MNMLVAFPEAFLLFGLITIGVFRFLISKKSTPKATAILILITALLCFLANTSRPESALYGFFISNENTSILKVIFLLFTAACAAFNKDYKQDLFFGFIAFGICLTVSSGSLPVLLVGIEIIFFSLYMMLRIWQKNLGEAVSLIPFSLTALSGFTIILAGIIFTYLDISPYLCGTLIIIGLLVKIGAFPFQTWIGKIYPKTSPATCALFSCVVSFLLIFVIFRIAYETFPSTNKASELLLSVVAIATIISASFFALRSDDAKTFLGYGNLVNTGIALSILGSGLTPSNYTSLLFFIIIQVPITIGLFASFQNIKSLDELQGNLFLSPKATLLNTVLILSLASAPPFAPFLGKYFLLSNMMKSGAYLQTSFVIIGIIFAFVYCFKILEKMFQENIKDDFPTSEQSISKVAIIAFIMALSFTFFSYELLNMCTLASEALIIK